MGAAVGQTADEVRPFLQSLRRTGYSGAVALFVDPALERALRGDPAARDVTLIRSRQWLPFKLGLWTRRRVMRFAWLPLQLLLWAAVRALAWIVPDEEHRFRLQLPLAAFACTPMEARFLRYRRFLDEHPHGRVLLTDVRDVLFQSDPFSALPRSGLAVSIESTAYTIATEPHNRAWVKRGYGPGMLERIGDCHVSCVGVTHGDLVAIGDYLEQMTGEILLLSPSRVGVGGGDTAIHNVLLWTGRLGAVHQLGTLASPVATFNGIDEWQVRVTPQGKVLNADGSQPSVLHQYDRLSALGATLRRGLAG
jgi:hypothetical protein